MAVENLKPKHACISPVGARMVRGTLTIVVVVQAALLLIAPRVFALPTRWLAPAFALSLLLFFATPLLAWRWLRIGGGGAPCVFGAGRAMSVWEELDTYKHALDEHAIISITDSCGRILHANQRFCQVSGYTRAELVGQTHRLINSGHHPPQFWASMWHTISGGHAWHGEVRNRARDGSIYWVDNTIVPWKDAAGKVTRHIAVSTEITERKLVEAELRRYTQELEESQILLEHQAYALEIQTQELRQAQTRAEAATRAKSEFLANMSHEIRSPLTAILGYADLIADEEGRPQAAANRQRYLETIRHAGQHLLTIINDILDLSKVEAGRLTLERIDMAVPTLLLELRELLQPRANEKGIELQVCLATPIPDVMLGDPTRLRQILMNLLGNAIKFTEAGRVQVTASIAREAAGQRLVIDVADTGPGMTQEQAAQLFCPFVQADNTVTRKYGGSGLGLVISRRLARMMSGDVTLARTSPGMGTCFRLELPVESAADAPTIEHLEDATPTPRATSTPSWPALEGRILLAEDGPDNQRLISLLLRKAGAEVEIAENGAVAWEKMQSAAAAGQPFDLLLTDIQMPVLDGYSLSLKLRASGWSLPIVALTAHAMAESRQRCLEAGCNEVATKPINRRQLLETCARHLACAAAARQVLAT